MSSQLHRVVVTGLGLVTPLGCGIQHNWQRVLDGKVGSLPSAVMVVQSGTAQRLADPDGRYSTLGKAAIGCIVPEGDQFNVSTLPATSTRNTSRAHKFAMHAAQQAWNDAAFGDDVLTDEIGVAYGQAMVDVDDVVNTGKLIETGKSKRISPYFVPSLLANSAAGGISIMHKLRGPNHTVSTACTTGAHAIGDAYNFIRLGMANGMVCGGGDACISPVTMHGFNRLRAIASSFDDPTIASRPFDKDRAGFVIGEGSGVLVLEALEHARHRGARIYAEVVGYGLSGDAHHVTSPDESGIGARLCMERALREASITSVDYVNAHATSTPVGDGIEARAIADVVGHGVRASSIKGLVGHLLGGAGSVEAICTILALYHGRIPHTVNLKESDIEADGVKMVKNEPINWPIVDRRRLAMSNSFGFGGTNAALCFAQFFE